MKLKRICFPDPRDPETEECTYFPEEFVEKVYSYYMLYRIDKSR